MTGSGTNLANVADFGGNLPSGTVNFAANETSQTVTVTVAGDTLVENDETFTVTLSNPIDTTIGTATAAGTIQNDDTLVSIAGTDADKAEGDAGNTAFTFTVTRIGSVSGASSVDYAVTGSGANPANAADFGGSLPSGTVNFAAGETSQTVTINISGDAVVENDETFTVTLSNPTGTTIAVAAAEGIIQDDDTVGITLTESGGTTNVTEGGFTDSYTLVLDSQPTANVQVTITPDAQTDLGNGAGVSVTLTFTNGNWNKAQAVTVTAVDDAIAEGSHSSTINHYVASYDGYYDGMGEDLYAAVMDNDTAGVVITETDGETAVSEGGATDSFDVVLTSEPTADVVVTLTSDAQVQLSSRVLTFTPANWNVAQTVVVTAVDDADAESTHISIINCAVSSHVTIYDALAEENIEIEINDNDNFYLFMPMVVNNFVTAPDLVVSDMTIDHGSLTVTIENQGTGAVTEVFVW